MIAASPPSDHMLELMIKVFQKTANPAELEQIRLWLKNNPLNQSSFDNFSGTWHLARLSESGNKFDPIMAWKKLDVQSISLDSKEAKNKVSPAIPFDWLKIAALVIITFCVGYGSSLLFRPSKSIAANTFTSYIVPFGSKSEIILPDGTNVRLNAGSTLKYATNFNTNHREVSLEGEAFFDVSVNKKIPFQIHTYAITVSVVGTAFNIKAYGDEKTIETTVERGIVNISGRENVKLEHAISLTARQRATLFFDKKHDSPARGNAKDIEYPAVSVDKNVSTELYTSWKDKRWIIEREELGNLAPKLARRYDVTIEFASESLKHFIFSGTIEEETLGQVLKVICLTAPVTYQLDRKHLVLKENKSMMHYFASPHSSH